MGLYICDRRKNKACPIRTAKHICGVSCFFTTYEKASIDGREIRRDEIHEICERIRKNPKKTWRQKDVKVKRSITRATEG